MSQQHDRQESPETLQGIFDRDEINDVLRETFYQEPDETKDKKTSRSTKRSKAKNKAKPKADHYEIVCISLYREDLDYLDACVAELKERGHRRVSRSSVVRTALEQMELDEFNNTRPSTIQRLAELKKKQQKA